MMIRQKAFRIGQRMKLHDSGKYGAGNAYPLPDGWNAGDQVTIVAFDHGWATVQDATGRQTQVFIINLDTGWQEFSAGVWRERKVSPKSSPDSSPDEQFRGNERAPAGTEQITVKSA